MMMKMITRLHSVNEIKIWFITEHHGNQWYSSQVYVISETNNNGKNSIIKCKNNKVCEVSDFAICHILLVYFHLKRRYPWVKFLLSNDHYLGGASISHSLRTDKWSRWTLMCDMWPLSPMLSGYIKSNNILL